MFHQLFRLTAKKKNIKKKNLHLTAFKNRGGKLCVVADTMCPEWWNYSAQFHFRAGKLGENEKKKIKWNKRKDILEEVDARRKFFRKSG